MKVPEQVLYASSEWRSGLSDISPWLSILPAAGHPLALCCATVPFTSQGIQLAALKCVLRGKWEHDADGIWQRKQQARDELGQVWQCWEGSFQTQPPLLGTHRGRSTEVKGLCPRALSNCLPWCGGRPWFQPPFHTTNILKAKTSSSSWHSAFCIARSLPSGYLINSKSQETVKADLTTIRILTINMGSTLRCTKHPNIHGLKWSTYGCYAVRISKLPFSWRFPGGSVVKNLSANAGDMGLIPGSGRSPGGGNRNPLSILAWEIPWTEEPGGLQLMGSQKSWIELSDQTTNTILWRRIWISQALSD